MPWNQEYKKSFLVGFLPSLVVFIMFTLTAGVLPIFIGMEEASTKQFYLFIGRMLGPMLFSVAALGFVTASVSRKWTVGKVLLIYLGVTILIVVLSVVVFGKGLPWK
jgi:hypothetical protein